MAHFDFNQRLCYYRLSKAKYYVPLHSPWSSKWHFRWASGQVNRREEKLNIVCQALCCGSSVAWGFFDFWRLAETKPFLVFCVPRALRKSRKQGLFRLFQKRRKIEKKREPGLVRDPDLSIFIISKKEEREKKKRDFDRRRRYGRRINEIVIFDGFEDQREWYGTWWKTGRGKWEKGRG